MKQNYIQLIVVLFIGLATISCSDNGTPTPFAYTQVFSGKTSKTWKLKSVAFKNTGDADWTLSDVCWTDERYTFYRDTERKFMVKSGDNKCNPNEKAFEIIDTWAFSNANASLYFIFPLLSDNTLPFIVKSVDKKKMTLEIYLNDAGSQSYQIVFEVVSED